MIFPDQAGGTEAEDSGKDRRGKNCAKPVPFRGGNLLAIYEAREIRRTVVSAEAFLKGQSGGVAVVSFREAIHFFPGFHTILVRPVFFE